MLICTDGLAHVKALNGRCLTSWTKCRNSFQYYCQLSRAWTQTAGCLCSVDTIHTTGTEVLSYPVCDSGGGCACASRSQKVYSYRKARCQVSYQTTAAYQQRVHLHCRISQDTYTCVAKAWFPSIQKNPFIQVWWHFQPRPTSSLGG